MGSSPQLGREPGETDEEFIIRLQTENGRLSTLLIDQGDHRITKGAPPGWEGGGWMDWHESECISGGAKVPHQHKATGALVGSSKTLIILATSCGEPRSRR